MPREANPRPTDRRPAPPLGGDNRTHFRHHQRQKLAVREAGQVQRSWRLYPGARSCTANRSVWSEELQANKALQPMANPLPGLSAAELSR